MQVKKVLRQQQVKPHWMFALDNLLRQAVQEALTVLLPGRVSSCSAQDAGLTDYYVHVRIYLVLLV